MLLRFPAFWNSCLFHISKRLCVQYFGHQITLITAFPLCSPLIFIFLSPLAPLWRLHFSGVISFLLKCLCLILGRVRPGDLGKHKEKGKGGSSEFTFELGKTQMSGVFYLIKTKVKL